MRGDAIRFTTQGDYACSYCGYVIPTNNRHELKEWISAEVRGMFCSRSHAIAAGNDIAYVSRHSHKVKAN